MDQVFKSVSIRLDGDGEPDSTVSLQDWRTYIYLAAPLPFTQSDTAPMADRQHIEMPRRSNAGFRFGGTPVTWYCPWMESQRSFVR